MLFFRLTVEFRWLIFSTLFFKFLLFSEMYCLVFSALWIVLIFSTAGFTPKYHYFVWNTFPYQIYIFIKLDP